MHPPGMDWFRKAVDKKGGIRGVADLAGVSRSHLKNLYREVRPLTWDIVGRLSPHLDVPESVWIAAMKARPPRKQRVVVTETTDAA